VPRGQTQFIRLSLVLITSSSGTCPAPNSHARYELAEHGRPGINVSFCAAGQCHPTRRSIPVGNLSYRPCRLRQDLQFFPLGGRLSSLMRLLCVAQYCQPPKAVIRASTFCALAQVCWARKFNRVGRFVAYGHPAWKRMRSWPSTPHCTTPSPIVTYSYLFFVFDIRA
jgi:hypothetical protein